MKGKEVMACESQVVMTHFRCSDGSTINWPYLDLALGETCTHKDDTCQPFLVTFSQPHLSEGQYLYCQDLLILTSKCWLKCQKDLFASKSQDDLHIKGMYNVYLKTECEEGWPTKQGRCTDTTFPSPSGAGGWRPGFLCPGSTALCLKMPKCKSLIFVLRRCRRKKNAFLTGLAAPEDKYQNVKAGMGSQWFPPKI